MLLARIACVLPLVSAISGVAVGQSIVPEALERARTELNRAIESGETVGAAHLVVSHDKVASLEVAGVSDIDEQSPLKVDAIVRIYSMTKPITTVTAMTLFEQGRFQLDDPVAKYIPAFERSTVLESRGESRKIVPPKRAITIRDVLRHTTGYSYGDGDPRVDEYYAKEGLVYRPPAGMLPPAMTIEQAAEALARIPALHHPGERFTYGFSTDLLGRLIEVWSGEALDAYMRRAVLEPLEMVDTGFSVPLEKRGRLASCHTRRDGKLVIIDKAADSPFNDGFAFLSGGGGLLSTMPDYANFCRMLVDGGTFKGKRLLKEETVKLMFTDQLQGIAGGFRFGLGFAIDSVDIGTGARKRQALQYSWGGYASTNFCLVPEEKLFQILIRQQVPDALNLAGKLFPMIHQGVASGSNTVPAP